MSVVPTAAPGGALIGRDAELAMLVTLVHEAAGGSGRAVLIEGEPGIGKSTLVRAALAELSRVAETDANVMPAIVECARVYASEGEICDALRAVWGIYRETPVF